MADDLFNRYDSIVKKANQNPQLNSSLYTAADTNPDEEAGLHKLSQKVGLPVEALRVDKGEEAKRLAVLRGRENLQTEAPATANFLSSQENAKVSHDDVDNLTAAEKALTFLGDYIRNDIPAIATTYGASIGGGVEESFGGLMQYLAEDEPVVTLYGEEHDRKANEAMARYAKKGADISAEGRMVSAEVLKAKPTKTWAGGIVRNAVQSIGAMAPGIVGGIATGNPAVPILTMGAQTFGEGYGEGRARGLTEGDATTSGSIQGATEMLTEIAPFVALTKFFKPGSFTTKMAGYYLAEFPGEAVATAVQNTTDKYFDDPNTTPEERKQKAIDYFFSSQHTQDQVDTFFTTLVQGLILSGTAKGVHAIGGKNDATKKLTEAAARTGATSKTLEALGEVSTNSKLRERLPEKFQEFIAKAKGETESVFIPADRWATFWQEQGIDPKEKIQEVMGDSTSFQEALASGGDVVIPLESYATRIAPTEFHKELSKDVRLHSGDMTQRELDEWGDRTPEEFDSIYGEVTKPEDTKVFDDVMGQLLGTGRERGTAEKEATLLQSVFRTLGERTGQDAFSLYEKYKLKISRPLPSVLANKLNIDTSIDPLLEALRAGKIPSEAEAFGPSLLEFLRETGVEDQGGELSALGIDETIKPFQKKIVRKYGLPLDKARGLAAEAGYVSQESSIRDFLDAIDKELRGKPVYSPQAERQDLVDSRLSLSQFKDYLESRGVDVTTTSNEEIRKILSEEQGSLYQDNVDEYGGEHRPPGPEDGAPLHDLTGGGSIYPEDIYSANGLRYYGTGQDAADRESMSVIQQTKGKPNATVTVYRAVPKVMSNSEKLAQIKEQMAAYMKRGKLPNDAFTSDGNKWYEWAYKERERLQALPDEPTTKISFNAGDWVSLSKSYVKEHGEGALNGNYKIISKKVKAKELFTNGDSINEFGYWPEGSKTLYQDSRPIAARLFERFEVMNDKEKLQELYIDKNTGTLNKRAFNLLPPKKYVAHISIEGTKWVNDNHSHEDGNKLYKMAGQALLNATEGVAKIGGDFAFYVDNREELDAVLSKANENLSGISITDKTGKLRHFETGSFRLTGEMGENLKEAGANHGEWKKNAEESGERAKRGAAPLNLKESPEAAEKKPEKIHPIGEELTAHFKQQSSEDQLFDLYIEKNTGLLTEDGFNAVRSNPETRKKYIITFDLNGLKIINAHLNEGNGDILLEAFGRAIAAQGGSRFDFAHKSGDEYYGQGDDADALQAFAEAVYKISEEAKLDFVLDDGTLIRKNGLTFGYGIGETYETADARLSEHKKQLTDLGIRGDEAELKRLERLAENGETRESADRERGSNREVTQGTEVPNPFQKSSSISSFINTALNDLGAATVRELYQSASTYENDLLKPLGKSLTSGDETLIKDYGDIQAFEADYKSATSRAVRYVKIENGEIVGALRFITQGKRSKKGKIDQVYTRSDKRRQGIASQLLRKAQEDFDVKHSDDLTKDGKAFKDADGVMYQETDGKRGSIKISPNREMEINLLEKADLSTFLHESGHFFFEVLSDLASEPDAPQQVKDDFTSLLKWFGVTDKSEVTTSHHERFARGFEAYLMEGKAPSSELSAYFQRFKAWLTRIYKDLKNLNVELTDEVKGVFDRLVATDEEIKRAQELQKFTPLFVDASTAGMTEREFQAYKKEAEKAHKEASENLEQKLLKELTRENEAWWKEESQKVRAEVEEEVKSEPSYQAFQVLTKGVDFEGNKAPEGFKISRQDLVRMYGEDFVKKLPRSFRYVYSKEGGLHPDEVAEVFGFSSGDELIRTMVNAPPMKAYVEAETMRRMRSTHGDMLNDGSITDEALKAVHTDAQGQVLRAELKALRRKQREVSPFVKAVKAEGEEALRREKQEREYERRWMEAEKKLTLEIERGAKEEELKALREEIKSNKEKARLARKEMEAGIPPTQAFKTWAAQAIGSKPIKSVNPNLYSRAEQKAGRLAFELASKGNFQKAGEEKQKQLLNHYLYLEAVTAKEEAEKVFAYANKLIKPASQERIGKAGGDYLEQINGILERYEFKKQTLETLSKRQNLREWIRQQEELGLEPSISEEVLGGLKKNYKELTIDELRAVRDALKNIEHLSREINRIRIDNEELLLEEALDELTSSVEQNFDAKKIPLDKETRSWLEKKGETLSRFDATLIKAEQLIEWMDGGNIDGPWARMIFRPIAQAEAKEHDLTLKFTKKLADLFEAYGKEKRLSLMDKIFIPSLNESITKQAAIAAALNTGNASNKRKLLEGYGWEENTLNEILSSLDESDWTFIQKTWDTIEELWPEIAALEKRLTGVAPPKVEPVKFENQYGEWRGGYYPVVYDPLHSGAGEKQSDSKGERLFESTYVKATTEKGHTKARIEEAAYPIQLSLEVIPQHMAQVIHDLTHREAVVTANRLLTNNAIRNVMNANVGNPYYKMLKQWLATVANDRNIDRTGNEFWRQFLMTLRTNATIVGMGFRATTMFAQLAGLSQSLDSVKGRYLVQAMTRFTKHPIEATTWVAEKSGEMRNRRNSLDRDIRDGIRKIMGKKGTVEWIQSKAFMGIALFDSIVSVPTWMGAYEQGKAEGLTEADSIAKADRAVRLSQGAGGAKDLAAVQRSNEMMKLFTMFYSYFSVLYNRLRNTGRLKSMGEVGWSDVAWKSFVMVMVPAILGELLAGRGPDDDEDEAWWVIKKVAAYPFLTIPILRDIVNTTESGRPYSVTPMSRVFEMTAKLPSEIEKVGEGKKDLDDFIFKAFDIPGYMFGLPTGQVKTTTKYIWDVMDGDIKPEDFSDVVKGLLFSPKKGGK